MPVIALAAIGQFHYNPDNTFLSGIIGDILATCNESFYVRKTVDELIYSGYSDSIIGNLTSALPNLKLLQEVFPNDKFGLFNGVNNTYSYTYAVYRGNADPSQIGQIAYYDGSKELTYWTDHCNDVNGTDGSMFGADVQKDINYNIFSDEIYRSVYIEYRDEVEISGIKGYRFVAGETLIEYPPLEPENYCFCPKDVCPPNGFIDVSTVKYHAPVYASFSNCLYCNTTYVDQTVGMYPDVSEDETFIVIEPYSGMAIQVGLKVQMLFNIEPYPGLTQWAPLQDLPSLVFPIVRFDEVAVIDQDLVDFLNDNGYTWIKISLILPYVLYAVGGSLVLIGLFIGFCCKTGSGKLV
jgi:hypothetical protein